MISRALQNPALETLRVPSTKPSTLSPSPRPALDQRGRDEVARAAAEACAGVGRGADVPESIHRRRVTAGRGKRAPQKALIQFGGATVWIAIDRVRVKAAQVARRQDVDRANLVVQIGGVLRDPVQYAGGISLGQRRSPA